MLIRIARADQPSKSHKISFRWIGSRRIVQVISSHVYICENINTLKREQVHYRWLQLYKAKEENQPSDSNLLKHAQFTEHSIQIVKCIHDIKNWAPETQPFNFWWNGTAYPTDAINPGNL